MILRDWIPGRGGGSDAGGQPPLETSLSLTQIADILSNERRVNLIEYMDDREEAQLGDVSEVIAALEGDESGDHRKRVYISLYQAHVPRLDDTGVLDVSRRTVLTRGPEFEPVRRALDCLRETVGS